MTKSELRSHFKELLRRHFAGPEEAVVQSQKKLVKQALPLLEAFPGVWGIYQPIRHEVSLLELTERRKDLSWVFPRLEGQGLRFCLPTKWESAQFGILQPTADCEHVPLEKIRGLFLPGLAFDLEGNRLGRGKGYYDYTLASYRGIKVGVALNCQISSGLPAEPHDVKVDWIVSEDSRMECQTGRG